MLHVHVLPGFGLSVHDVCPACEFTRLTELGVPAEIALPTARLRGLVAPDDLSPRIINVIREGLAELEKKYGKKIP
ncbi:hypothetical protein A2V54_00270 [candidate division WWE3 bacterium RBG_19FT_COMBO_53_11]|uniref:Uncharacterized protein n=1 Tax=candidate division WWE3 bacterium RBG_19FT_COMBO_53_11 TaxID=1802613 RepID=A0A1F4UHR3_UNCKA|nr:MAG: hypothetical protein A2155_00965 [candidate division WWE3 bacterium RBG_16_52_45]OGC44442.1 MAG: hypothetical protein A2V54_00270 [candidate division WWE3 bacterium RBG_19FT_COMBO_53_11]